MTQSKQDRRSSDLLAGLGHALRTPLNSILGMSELLLESPLEPRQRELSAGIHDSGIALLELAKDLLDLSRLDSEPPTLARQHFDPGELLEDTARAYLSRARATRIEIKVYAEGLPPALVGDGGRLRQVVAHLLSNALLHTESGRIAISADVVEKGAAASAAEEGEDSTGEDRAGVEKVALKVRVTDTGRGIPESARQEVFEPFALLATSASGKPSGSGLALAVARRTVELLGGEIGFESWEGSGATFWFLVPFELGDAQRTVEPELAPSYLPYEEPWPEAEPSPAVEEKKERAEIRILVAEDNPVNQLLAVHQLRFLGFGVEAVGDGIEALELLAGQPFDLVLMDCEMPGIDGYETTRRLRASSGPARHVPIVAVTAHADEGQRERCLRAGM
ncbi:MAG: ATP-binding protein, partial [Holophagales bacterium]|nr:ATP-binding protein [Holophagales bacterium]